MVSIHSEAEHEFIKAFNGESPWVGAQRNSANKWFWSDGTPWDFHNWANGAPHAPAPGLEDCAHKWNGDEWNDKPCSFVMPFVCKEGKK